MSASATGEAIATPLELRTLPVILIRVLGTATVGVTVTLATVTPTVAVPRTRIRINGSVRNSGGVAIASPVALALIGQSSLTSRQAVSNWATTTAEQTLENVAQTSLGKTLGPGAVAVFTLTIPADAISHSQSFAILPLRVEVTGTTSTGTQQSGDVHTFLPTLASIKAFEPLSIAWLVPLTLDPDPALHGPVSPARTAAWARAIGPGSRLVRLIQGTEDANVTWAIDPAILGPQETPPGVDASAEPTPSASQSAAPGHTAIPDPVTEATTALAARLKAAAPRHTLWSLPYADPDLAALLPLPSGNQVLNSVISHPSTLDVAVGPARADIAWPLGETLTLQSQTLLRRAFASPGLAAAVTSASTLNTRNATANASRKASSGLPLLALRLALAVALRVFRVEAEVTAAASPGEAKARRNRVWLCRVSVSPRGHAMSARAGPTATSRVEG